MEQKRGIQAARGRIEIGGHFIGNEFRFVGLADAAIAECMEAEFADVLDLLYAVGADDVVED